ncbi:MAG: hypothetical protein N3I86_01260 [Verrucomicrobiae bacterium]|nr:hypothetical protein [Verrucomicrobiae bacterium]MDW8308392.1 hypothetical protein [Verrucomicrobiales bacterium]
MSDLEERLRTSKPRTPPPPDLHDAIMAAVRARREIRPTPKHRVTARWLVGLMVGVGLGLAGISLWRADTQAPAPHAATPLPLPPNPPPETVWASPARMTEMMLSPLSHEMAAVERDVRGAWEFLLARLP